MTPSSSTGDRPLRRLAGMLLVLGLIAAGLLVPPQTAAGVPACPSGGASSAPQLPDNLTRPSGSKLSDEIREYRVENPAVGFSNDARPHRTELAAIPRNGTEQVYDEDPARRRIAWLRYWQRQLARDPGSDWVTFRDGRIRGWRNNTLGAAFERSVKDFLHLGADWEWECDKPGQQLAIPGALHDRHYDALYAQPGATVVAIEAKAGRAAIERLVNEYLDKDVENSRATGAIVINILGEQPTPDELEDLQNAANDPTSDVRFYVLPSKPIDVDPFNPPPTALGGGGVHNPTGPVLDSAGASAATPEEAEETVEGERAAAQESGDPDDVSAPGGIDFSTLQLSYLKNTQSSDGPGAEFAFSARLGPDDRFPYGGRRTLGLISDAFFVSLALPDEAFTVNLNPDTPDDIMDARLGRTEPGRVMLEADLQLKKSTAKLLRPDSATGRRFWRSLGGGELQCVTTRTWIVPEAARVREDGDELYLLDTPLGMRSESTYIKTPTKRSCSGLSSDRERAQRRRGERLFRSLIVPRLQREVNTAPAYADLRRVYRARVAAQWIRDRNAGRPTAYAAEIGSGNVAQWPFAKRWTPQHTYRAYLQSYRHGEFDLTRKTVRTRGDTRITRTVSYFFGGVDFRTSPTILLDGAAMAQRYPRVPALARTAVREPAEAGGTVWLGGSATPDPDRNGVANRRRQEAQRASVRRAVVLAAGAVLGLTVVGATGAALAATRRRSGKGAKI